MQWATLSFFGGKYSRSSFVGFLWGGETCEATMSFFWRDYWGQLFRSGRDTFAEQLLFLRSG